MSIGGAGADDVYAVVFQVDDSDEARAVQASIARQKQLHAQWQSTMGSMNQAAGGASKATDQASKAMGGLGDAAGKVGDTVKSLFRGLAESAPAILAVRAITAAMTQGVAEAAKLADQTQAMRDSLRDIVGITGGGGVGAKPLAEHLQLMQAAGMSSQEAHGFRETFLGEAEAYKDRMKPEEYEELQTRSAKMAMSFGLKPETMAMLSGRLISRAAPGTTAGGVIGEAGEIQRLLQSGSGVTSRIMDSYLQSMSSLTNAQGTGLVSSPRSLAVMAAGASRLGPESTIDTTLENFSKAVGGLTRNKDWSKFIREDVGIKESTPVEIGMEKLFQKMEQVSGPGARFTPEQLKSDAGAQKQLAEMTEGQGEQGRNLYAYLKEQGLKDTQALRSVVGMFGQREILRREMGRPQEERMGAAEVEAKITEAYDPRSERGRALRRRQADAHLVAAEVEQGKDYEEARRFRIDAAANLRQARVLSPENMAEQEMKDYLTGKKLTGEPGEQVRLVEQEAFRLAMKEKGMKFEEAPFNAPGHIEGEGGGGFDPGARGAWSRRILGFELEENLKRANDAARIGDRSRMIGGIGQQGESLTVQEATQQGRLMPKLVETNEKLLGVVTNRNRGMMTQPMPGNQPQP
jgi:hypothetical protein